MREGRSHQLIVLTVAFILGTGCKERTHDNSPLAGPLNSLYEAVRLAGFELNPGTFTSRNLRLDWHTANLEELANAAERLGCRTRLMRTDIESLLRIDGPMIALTHDNRTLVIASTRESEKKIFLIGEKGKGYWASLDRFLGEWGGEILVFERATPRPTPKLWSPAGTVDLGVFAPGTKASSEVPLFNLGSKSLEIESVSFSCDCARGGVSPENVAAGEAFRLHLDVDVSRKGMGNFGFSVLLMTNDPKHPRTVVKFMGVVKPPFMMDPPYYTFGDIPPTTDELPLTFRVHFLDDEVEEIQPINLDPGLVWEGQRVHLDGSREVRLRLKLAKVVTNDEGGFRTRGVFSSGREGSGVLTAGAIGRRLSWIEVLPKVVYLGDVLPSTTIIRELRVKTFGSGPLTVEHGGLEAVTSEVVGDAVVVKILMPEGPGLFRSKLTLKQAGRAVEVPILGMVSGPGRGT